MHNKFGQKNWNKIAISLFALVVLGSFLVSNRIAEVEQASLIDGASMETDALYQSREYKNILELQAAFVRNAKRIKPSVVSINNLKEIKDKKHPPSVFNNSSSTWSFDLRDWLEKIGRKRYLARSMGSGILLKDNGYILTNYHVIQNTERLMVRLSDGREYRANIVGKDPKTDLAILKIFSFRSFPDPPFGQSEQLGVGEWVMAIGNPYGLEGTVTVGVVSAVGRSDLGIATFENFIQTDASINPGNSGGPLINLKGEIVGINTAIAEIGAGVGFAIPIEMAVKISEDLIRNGKVERGWLGVGIQTLTPELAESFHLPDKLNGVLINSIDADAPGESGGLRRGDIIIQYDGQPISNSKNLQNVVAQTSVGKTVPIQIIRDGKQKILNVTIGKLSS